MNNTLIELKDINKIYHQGAEEIKALDNVSITIKQGEFVAIIGCSGSGKSTLMNMIGCLDKPTSGDYTLNGVDVLSMKDNDLSKIRNKEIGFIFQGFNLVSGLTAYENVELPLIYRKMPKSSRKEIATKALERVSLSNRTTHRPFQMSGGQQQRVAIARALAAEPPIILADEPTGNLDSNSGTEVMNTLIHLNEQGKTIILITHDNSIAAKAKRIIKIVDGRITEDIIKSN